MNTKAVTQGAIVGAVLAASTCVVIYDHLHPIPEPEEFSLGSVDWVELAKSTLIERE